MVQNTDGGRLRDPEHALAESSGQKPAPRAGVRALFFNTSIRSRIWQLTGVSCLALLVLGITLVWTFERSRDASDQVQHTLNIRKALADYTLELVNAETGQRGYLLTHQDAYLMPYRQVLADNKDQLAKLGDLIDNSPEKADLRKLADIFSAKLRELTETIHLAQAGDMKSALDVVREGSGRQYTIEFQRLGREISDAEIAQLAKRQTAASNEDNNVLLFTGIGGLFALILIVGAAQATVARIGGPLDDLMLGIAAIADGKFDRRLNIRSRDELGRVATAINAMTERLAASDQARSVAEAALKASEETFRITLDSAPVGIALLTPEGRLIKANHALKRMGGYSRVELLTLDPRKVLPAFAEDRVQIGRLLSGEIDRYEMEQLFVPSDGKAFWTLVIASLARNPDGSPRHIVKQVMDISERKEMDRMKSEFISVVSHELRTPLTAIRGSLGLLATTMSSTLSERALHLVQIGYRNCERLIVLVNDILDMEKLAANQMAFEPRIDDLIALVRQSLEANAPFAEKYGVAFELNAPEKEIEVFLDPVRFEQVLTNLLSNAAKFSPQSGQVDVTVRRLSDRARVEVRDYGPGIAEEFKPHIFGRFRQADSSVTRAKGGTGLGLHITRDLVERMGGWIGFESTLGKGTTFWAEFPLASVRSVSTAHAATQSPRDLPHILVCDDDPQAASILRVAMERNGCRVDMAHSLKGARDLLEKNDYAAMTLDLVLPDGDGISLFEELRSHSRTSQLPVIVISIKATECRESYNGPGTDLVDWISKPINEWRLDWAIRQAIAMGHTATPRILHVEDDADLSSMLATSLRGRAELVCAMSLRDAEELLATDSFAAVVLDLGMPDGCGLSLVERIAALEPPPPVIVFSARELTADDARRVAAVLIKSRATESQVVQTVLDLANPDHPMPRRAAS